MAARKRQMIVLTAGLEDGGRRAALAFGSALAALATGDEVHVFLALDAARLGTQTGCVGITPRGFSDPLETYIEEFLAFGGHLEVCSSCYEEYCRNLPAEADQAPPLRANTVIAGLSLMASRAHEMPIVTF